MEYDVLRMLHDNEGTITKLLTPICGKLVRTNVRADIWKRLASLNTLWNLLFSCARQMWGLPRCHYSDHRFFVYSEIHKIFICDRAGTWGPVWDHLPSDAECSGQRCSVWYGSRCTCHVSIVIIKYSMQMLGWITGSQWLTSCSSLWQWERQDHHTNPEGQDGLELLFLPLHFVYK